MQRLCTAITVFTMTCNKKLACAFSLASLGAKFVKICQAFKAG